MAKPKIGIKISQANPSDDWQIQDDFRTICRAKEIECDKKRMDKVREFAKKQMMDAASIASEQDENC